MDAAHRSTHNALFVLKVRVILLHGSVDGLEGRHQVVEDGRAPCLALLLSKTTGIDNAHLLQHGGLSTLASTCVLSQYRCLYTRARRRCNIPSSRSFTSRSAFFLSKRRFFSISSLFLDVGSGVAFRPKHIVAGAI
jgi:hypothetical protein